MRAFQVECEGKLQWVYAARVKDGLWFHHKGETFFIAKEEKKISSRRRQDQGPQTGKIKAPMPGKVIKVLKNVGDSVEAGEKVIVLEAMKMEYSLEADTSGVIDSLLVKENQQVSVGDLLAQVSRSEDDQSD